MLLHEAGHGMLGHEGLHVQCDSIPPEQCDQTPDGAFGLGAWFLHRVGEVVKQSGGDCSDFDGRLSGTCHMINDPGEWTPCEWSCWDY